jgi:hypothetical protein
MGVTPIERLGVCIGRRRLMAGLEEQSWGRGPGFCVLGLFDAAWAGAQNVVRLQVNAHLLLKSLPERLQRVLSLHTSWPRQAAKPRTEPLATFEGGNIGFGRFWSPRAQPVSSALQRAKTDTRADLRSLGASLIGSRDGNDSPRSV